ncbi:MAG TPA: hypothetical protein VHC49_09075, partial [Mycobacteriales bacterium]|nr:hypothetical protein [Mycobacteriales bacterium]
LLGYVVVALVAAGVAVAVTLLVSDSGPSSPTVAPSGNALPGPNGGLNGGPQGGGQPSGGVATLLIAGRVSAVSSRSITLTGPQGAVTAAITDSTRISGSISRAADIDVGDVVSMQISQSGGKSTATSIQDPAQIR